MVKIELEETSDLERILKITVDAELVDEALASAYRKLQGKTELPGYRKGKVPRSVLKKRFGDSVAEEVGADLAAKAFEESMTKHELIPAANPKVTVGALVAGEPFDVSISIILRPAPELKDYSGIFVEPEDTEVTDQEIEEQLESMCLQGGHLVGVTEERAVEDGDIVDFTLKLTDGSDELTQDHRMELPDDPIHPFLIDTIRGMWRDQKAETQVTTHEEYGETEWARRTCMAEVTIKQICTMCPADLDEDFAKAMGCENLDELRDTLRVRIQDVKQRRSRDHEVREIIKIILERNPLDLPTEMVAERAQALVKDIAAQMMDGMSATMNPTLDDLTDEKRVHVVMEAEYSVKRELVLEAISRQEKLTIDESDRDAFAERLAKQSGQPLETIRETLSEGNATAWMDATIKEEKAVGWLRDQARSCQ